MANGNRYDQEIEKRRHERLLKDSKLHYDVLPGGELSCSEPVQEATLVDIGGGGLRFVTDEPLDKRTQLVIKLQFSGWRDDGSNWVYTRSKDDQCSLMIIGLVMWSAYSDSTPGKYEVGVSFSGRIQ